MLKQLHQVILIRKVEAVFLISYDTFIAYDFLPTILSTNRVRDMFNCYKLSLECCAVLI